MKIFYNKVFKNYLVLMLTMLSVEMIFKYSVGTNIIDWSTLRIFLSCSFLALLLSLLFSFLPRIANNICCVLFALLFSIYTFLQAGFQNFLGVYLSFGTTSQAAAVKDYVGDFMNSIKTSYYLILLPFILCLLFYIFVDKKIRVMESNDEIDFSDKFSREELKIQLAKDRKKQRIKDQFGDRIIGLFFLIAFGYGFYYSLTASFMQNELQLTPTKSLFKSPSSPSIAINQFGAITYGLLDIKDVIIPGAEEITMLDSYKLVEQEQTSYTRKINSSYWEEVIANEKNPQYKTLSNYFISKTITDKNAYTGLFEDKNLIVIMMESATNIALDPTYYPNLYKLYNEGWAWDNSYSPRSACNTGNNEMSGLTSLFTINKVCTANQYKENVYPEALLNLFKNKEYSVQGFHNYTDQYYYRHKIIPNMGADKYWGVDDLGISYTNVYKEWPSDVELFEKVLEKTQDKEKFMAWVVTVTSHAPYNQSSVYGDKYLDLFKDTKYSIAVKRYMSKLKELDNGIGTLLEGLEKQGKLDDTVIVVFADHYPYDINEKELNAYFDYDITVNNEIDRTPFIIYNSKIKATKYDEYTSYMNITPTLANLFNLDYDPRLYAGFDILSRDYENRVVFADGSWQDPKAFYEAATGTIKYTNGNDSYTVDEIKAINESVKLRIEMSNLAIKTNYFKYINDEISKVKVQKDLEKTEEVKIEPEEDEDED